VKPGTAMTAAVAKVVAAAVGALPLANGVLVTAFFGGRT
jgi:hypothetical protein